jgi:hypothetical protein
LKAGLFADIRIEKQTFQHYRRNFYSLGRRHHMTRRREAEAGLQKNGGQLGKNIFHDSGGHGFQAFAGTCPQVQGAGLIATHDSGCACAASVERDGESRCTGEVAAAGNRQHYRNPGEFVELVGGNHQNRAGSPLFMAFSWVKGHQINVSAPHQTSSSPLAVEEVQALSSSDTDAEASHWASNSCSVYFFLSSGSITNRPLSTAMFTVDPEPSRSISSMAGGTASITEPPTFLNLLVYMTFLQKLYFYITHNSEMRKSILVARLLFMFPPQLNQEVPYDKAA